MSVVADRLAKLNNIEELDADVEKFLHSVDRHLASQMRKAASRVAEIKCLKEGVAYQIQTGGKRIRAALCVTSCELFGGSYLRALGFAAAIEHLQNFTLIHDDIADGDLERRSQEATWVRYGIAHAINIGDVFVPLSSMAILETTYAPEMKLKLMQIVSRFGLEVAEGQSLDINLRQNNAPTVEEYMECTQTGAFLAMATVGGGIIGGASSKDLRHLKDFAMLAGTAFQIKDDLLDLIGGKGRNLGSDILEGKRTLFAVYAAQQAAELERRRLLRILNKPRNANTPNELEWVRDLYRRTGAIDYAENMAARLIEQATQYVSKFPESEAKYRLIKLSKYLSMRLH